MKDISLNFVANLLLTPVLAIAQQSSPPRALNVEDGAVANRTYTNECLGFSFPLPEGWEVDTKLQDTNEGRAKRVGVGLILLVLDQHTGRPLMNRMLLVALDASSSAMDAQSFVSKVVHAQVNQNTKHVLREPYPTEIVGKRFFRADYDQSDPGGTTHQVLVATKFRNYFLGWTLVSPSTADLDEMVQTLPRISFREDRWDPRCISAPGPQTPIMQSGIVSSRLPVPAIAHVARVRVSQTFAQGMLLTKVQPHYPEEARRNHIQGDVVLRALIDEHGNVEGATLEAGDPVLASSAIDAVKQWKYKPYLLNNQPIAMATQVTVRFELEPK